MCNTFLSHNDYELGLGIILTLRTKMFQGAWRFICIIYDFFDTEMAQVVEILPHGR